MYLRIMLLTHLPAHILASNASLLHSSLLHHMLDTYSSACAHTHTITHSNNSYYLLYKSLLDNVFDQRGRIGGEHAFLQGCYGLMEEDTSLPSALAQAS